LEFGALGLELTLKVQSTKFKVQVLYASALIIPNKTQSEGVGYQNKKTEDANASVGLKVSRVRR
jgi:hypothetical protein